MCIILDNIYVADHTDTYKYISCFFSFLILIIVTKKSIIYLPIKYVCTAAPKLFNSRLNLLRMSMCIKQCIHLSGKLWITTNEVS